MNIITSIIGILIGGGILAFIQFLITRHDSKHDKQEEILNAIGKLSGEIEQVKADADKRDAIQARTHILRFSDELYDHVWHSKEYFEQTLDDIKVYNQFCERHPEFANGRTEAAAEYIRAEYDRITKEHKFERKEGA